MMATTVRHRSAYAGLAALVGWGVVIAGAGITPAAAAAPGTTIHVPADQPTVQAAIDAASAGDTVLVSPGTYQGDIDFDGKAITVRSVAGASRTTLEGDGRSSVVTFHSGEPRSSVLAGFTIRGGAAPFGGGIYVTGASPTIRSDVITANQACYGGGGVYVMGAAVAMFGDSVTGNRQEAACAGRSVTGGGGGLEMTGTVGATVTRSTVSGNTWSGTSGGGIFLFNPGTVRLFDSFVQHNAPGGVAIFDNNTASIIQNLVTDNTGGPGLSIVSPGKAAGPLVTGDTVVGGGAQPALVVSGVDAGDAFYNDIFVSGYAKTPAVVCQANTSRIPPTFVTDLAWSGSVRPVSGTCVPTFTGHGNLTGDPRFLQPTTGYYQLTPGSPAVNAGTDKAPGVTATDLIGNPRIVGGRIDLGPYELQGTTT